MAKKKRSKSKSKGWSPAKKAEYKRKKRALINSMK